MWVLVFMVAFTGVPQYAEAYDTKVQCEIARDKIIKPGFFVSNGDQKGLCIPLVKN